MTQEQLAAMLESMTGHLVAQDEIQKKQLQQARKVVASSLISQKIENTGAEQLFYKANLYDRELIDTETIKNIETISAKAIGNITPEANTEENVFVRSVPVLNAAIAGSKPDWAASVAPSQSLGPFLNNEGREIWIDIYRVEKLVTIYLGAQPILMFKTTLRGLQQASQLNTSYRINAGSVWIYAQLFSAAAPAGHFVGVQAKSGTLNLSIKPTLQNGNITINAATRFDISLQLVPHEDANTGETSPYGKDAREAKYFLPETWAFSWQQNKAAITQVGPASCVIYGQDMAFDFTPAANLAVSYMNGALLIPWKANISQFQVSANFSPWLTLADGANIQKSFWALPTTALNISSPVAVTGNGMIMLQCGNGLRVRWSGLENEDVRLTQPTIIGKPGDISITDQESDGLGASHHFELWADKQNPHGTTADVSLQKKTPFILVTSSSAIEMISTFCAATIFADRPVKVDGAPFPVTSSSSNFALSAGKNGRRVILMEDDALASPPSVVAPPPIKPQSIVLENALFTVSPVKTFILIGECDDAMVNVKRGNLILAFALLRYIPTLPDPYVAKLGSARRGGKLSDSVAASAFNGLLICFITFAENGGTDDVKVNFYFGGANLPAIWELPETQPVTKAKKPDRVITAAKRKTVITPLRKKARQQAVVFGNLGSAVKLTTEHFIPEIVDTRIPELKPKQKPELNIDLLGGFKNGKGEVYKPEEWVKLKRNMEDAWDAGLGVKNDFFSLLDVSSNANQMGVSFGAEWQVIRTGKVRGREGEEQRVNYNVFPLLVDGMQVKLPSNRVRAFTLPLMAWEPEINQTPPDRDDPDNPDTPNSPKLIMDPEAGPMYYANDGGPAHIWNNNTVPVPLAPLPLTNALIEHFKSQPDNYTLAAFTLPFGLKAISYISKNFIETNKPTIENIQPKFRKDETETDKYKLTGGLQLSLQAGNYGKPAMPSKGLAADDNMFPGYTMQANNLLNWLGIASYASNLGHRVTEIFNNEFLFEPLNSNLLELSRGVPVKRMDITGYGANMFSNWVSERAFLAQTSQARFDVLLGRTSHEVIQVKSILYPWGIRVVRTITVFRTGAAIVYRTDSGWKAESDGLFNFSYSYKKTGQDVDVDDAYEIHPGIIKGLFNVRNIKDAPSVTEYFGKNTIQPNTGYLNGVKGEWLINGPNIRTEDVKCGGVYFDADVEIENVVQGHVNKRVVSKKILGYVQVSPAGKPLTAEQLAGLLALQNGSIGGDLDCVVDVNKSGQQMQGARFDMNVSINKGGTNPVFVAALRGPVFLPKDGSWSLVQHNVGSGEVTPLSKDTMIPLIREGMWMNGKLVDNNTLTSKLVRVAHPMEILRDPKTDTVNFGYLQSTATQKALFLTPAYGSGIDKLLSKTPPVFADAYRLMTGESIFPNIGNAIDNFGKAMPLLNSKDGNGNTFKAFVENALEDGGGKVLELMQIEAKKAGDAVIDQGMSLLKKGAGGLLDKALQFVVPPLPDPFSIPLVSTKELKIYIEYKAGKKGEAPKDSKLDFDVTSFANNAAEQWKSRLNNVAMVVDLGEMKRLMTIKGNFDAKKGKESNYEGGPTNGTEGLPVPELEFSDALQPVIDILQMLAALSTGDYGETMKKGLKIAMSNSGEIWQYKFEAQKEIATIRFPPTDELYNSAQTPLKLEASLSAGVYFNAALKVTTDPTQLLPTAGAFLKFNGGLQVMCTSVGVGSIYAIGAVEVKIAADTKVGPSLYLKFGFGVSIVVSLPVVGNASVTFMVGAEMYADKDKVIIAALMLFKGQANLLGGLVCVTITIEAKGIVVRDNVKKTTDCSAQVTFAIDISIFLIIDISFSKTWGEDRQVA